MAPCNYSCMQVRSCSPNICRHLSSCSNYLYRHVFFSNSQLCLYQLSDFLLTGYSIPKPTMIKALRWITYINVSSCCPWKEKSFSSNSSPFDMGKLLLLPSQDEVFAEQHSTVLKRSWRMNFTRWTEHAQTWFRLDQLTKTSRLPIKSVRLLDLYLVKSSSMVIVSLSWPTGLITQTHGGYVQSFIYCKFQSHLWYRISVLLSFSVLCLS